MKSNEKYWVSMIAPATAGRARLLADMYFSGIGKNHVRLADG